MHSINSNKRTILSCDTTETTIYPEKTEKRRRITEPSTPAFGFQKITKLVTESFTKFKSFFNNNNNNNNITFGSNNHTSNNNNHYYYNNNNNLNMMEGNTKSNTLNETPPTNNSPKESEPFMKTTQASIRKPTIIYDVPNLYSSLSTIPTTPTLSTTKATTTTTTTMPVHVSTRTSTSSDNIFPDFSSSNSPLYFSTTSNSLPPNPVVNVNITATIQSNNTSTPHKKIPLMDLYQDEKDQMTLTSMILERACPPEKYNSYSNVNSYSPSRLPLNQILYSSPQPHHYLPPPNDMYTSPYKVSTQQTQPREIPRTPTFSVNENYTRSPFNTPLPPSPPPMPKYKPPFKLFVPPKKKTQLPASFLSASTPTNKEVIPTSSTPLTPPRVTSASADSFSSIKKGTPSLLLTPIKDELEFKFQRKAIQQVEEKLKGMLIKREESKKLDFEYVQKRKEEERMKALQQQFDDRKNGKQNMPFVPQGTRHLYTELLRITSPASANEILSSGFNIEVKRADLILLLEPEWLNDEVINFYINLLSSQSWSGVSKEVLLTYPKTYFFNTHFFSLLSQNKKADPYDYTRVRRWTKQVDIFSYEILVVPVHLGSHWCLAVIDLGKQMLIYYDSLGGNNYTCLAYLRRYLQDEHQSKKGKALDLKPFQDSIPKNIPMQKNGYDCGVFMCQYAKYTARNEEFKFAQKDIRYLRKVMIWEILNKVLLI